MKLSLVIVTAALVYLEGCLGAYWNQNSNNNGPRRQMQRMGRDRPRPMRHHRHISPHHRYPRPPPSRINNRPPSGPPGHRRASRPPPPQFRHNFPHQNQGAMLIQPMMHNTNNVNPHSVRNELGVPPPFFQQDEIIQEQSKHFPVTAIASPNHLHSSVPANFLSGKDSQPHGYLSSTYKGWKPIVKPYQNSYMTPASVGGPQQSSAAYGMMHAQNSKNIIYSSHPTPALNLDTLFREHTEHMKQGHNIMKQGQFGLKQAYSENQGVRVPPPPPPLIKPIKAVELPLWNKRLSSPPPVPNNNRQPEEGANQGVNNNNNNKKPLFSRPKLPPKQQPQAQSNAPPSTEDSQEAPKFPKFKLRQRPNRPAVQNNNNRDAAQESQLDHTTSVLPPFPGKHLDEATTTPQDHNVKSKINTRGRVRVRTKPKPESTTPQSGEEFSSPKSKPGQRFPNSNGEQSQSENSQGTRNPPNYGRPQPPPSNPTEDSSSEEFGQYNGNRSPQRPQNNNHHYQNPNTEPRPPSHVRNHHQHHTDQRERRPVSNLIEGPPPPLGGKSSYSEGPSQFTETEPNEDQQQPQRGRRKRPKNKNGDPTTQQPLSPPPPYPENQQTFAADDSYFPPGFHTNPSKNTGQHPVSFMTMPGGKPQVIHHTYPSHHSPQQQQLYPINVMRSPPAPDFQRPTESHGSNPHGNYVSNNRPHFPAINVQNGPGQPHNGQKPPPLRFPHHQHNSGPVFTSNSNHEPSYFPVAFGSNHAPHTFGGNGNGGPPFPPPPLHVRQHNMPHSSMSPPSAQHSGPPPMRHPPPMSTSTMRYPRYQSSSAPSFPPSSSSSSSSSSPSSSYSSVEMRDSSESSPFPMHTDPPSSTPPGFRHQNPERSNAPPPFTFPEYAPAYTSSVEYDKIPMQFMDQLRPILRDDRDHEPSTTTIRHNHQSPDIHPPSSFFDDFFQPFDQTFNANPEQELDSKPTQQIENHVQPQYNNFNAYEGYNAEQSSPQPNFALLRPPPAPKDPVSSYSPPFISTLDVVPANDNDFIQVESGPVWSSKLQDNDLVLSSTEQQPIISSTPSAPLKKYANEIKTHKPQQYHHSSSTTTARTRIEPKTKVNNNKDGQHHREVILDHKTESIPPAVTTYKPSRFEKHEEEEEEDAGQRETFGLKKYHPTKLRDQPDDDNVDDSNTPRSARFPERDNVQPIIATSTTESPESTTGFKSRRHFRRRRPDASVRRRFFSSRVTSANDEDKQRDESSTNPSRSISLGRPTKATTTTTTATAGSERQKYNPIVPPVTEHDEDGYEPSRVSTFKQRRLLGRRKNLSSTLQTLKDIDDTSSTTTPSQQPPTSSVSSAESETVTYGESQWFRIKPTDSSELDTPAVFNSKLSKQGGFSSSSIKSGGKELKKGSSVSTTIPQFLPLELSSEMMGSSTEAGVKTSYSSKHSVSYVDGMKFPVHKKKTSSSSS